MPRGRQLADALTLIAALQKHFLQLLAAMRRRPTT
jgi:hypothetical protein